ncbi:hypothetical protein [Pseudoduganella aquatica]|uniref:Uncharacterized protein n=1 Tax=Pseudoduganella aquatica TaxID=2660641 RepID=A0A7X4HFK2_9BURK|nr:hypothetical protein [Pseudoduganella aquatica]MYN10289.1 hypothetical protein [Pseudoduganella aquatica]
MNPTERMTAARPATAAKRQGEIDQHQYLLDKAARLAREAAAAQAQPAPAKQPAQPAESDTARQARLVAALNAARAGGSRG